MPWSVPGGNPPPGDVGAGDDAAGAWRRAAAERERAGKAGEIAARHEARASSGPESMRPLRARLAALHWQTQERHLVAATLHELHAARMEEWRSGRPGDADAPVFMSAVAAAIGLDGAAAEIRGNRPAAVAAASSNAMARAAHDLEMTLGEGPAVSAVARRALVRASGPGLAQRWPLYGTAVAELGVRAVVAAPLRSDAGYLGALCAYGGEAVIRDAAVVAVGRIAEALTYTMLLPGEALLGELDYQVVVHQAAGMMSVRCGCGVDDAEAVLRARAFTEGRPVEAIAASIVRGEAFPD